MRQIIQDCDFLKKFPLINALPLLKLQKLRNLTRRQELGKNKILYKEGDMVNGVYFIQSGEILYEKVLKEDDTMFTNRKWMQPKFFKGSNIKKLVKVKAAIFEHQDVVGFEELLRQLILFSQKQIFIETKKKEGLAV